MDVRFSNTILKDAANFIPLFKKISMLTPWLLSCLGVWLLQDGLYSITATMLYQVTFKIVGRAPSRGGKGPGYHSKIRSANCTPRTLWKSLRRFASFSLLSLTHQLQGYLFLLKVSEEK